MLQIVQHLPVSLRVSDDPCTAEVTVLQQPSSMIASHQIVGLAYSGLEYLTPQEFKQQHHSTPTRAVLQE